MRITPSIVTDDGALVEQILDKGVSRYAIYEGSSWRRVDTFEDCQPLSSTNNLITHGVVAFPTEVSRYPSREALAGEIRSFIHRYVDIPPFFEALATAYVLFSWIFDAFNELPYLRVQGDYGSGKTRFLQTVGSLCYKPIFASGASTISPLFRIIDLVQGTLILDESDFRASDERAAITKILNNGNAKGFPVLRSEQTPQKEYNPRAFRVFSPKVLATRHPFEDQALESRCLTHEMGGRVLRDDIPINLPDSFHSEAERLRNKLLWFRFQSFHKATLTSTLPSLEPRLSQVFTPLLSVIDDVELQDKLVCYINEKGQRLKDERSWELGALVLAALLSLQAQGRLLSVKAITDRFNEHHMTTFGEAFQPRQIGTVLRKELRLTLSRQKGRFIVGLENIPRIMALSKRYGTGGVDVG